jgi:hypothetical protein
MRRGPAAFECFLDRADVEAWWMSFPQKRHGLIVRADKASRPAEAEARRIKERPQVGFVVLGPERIACREASRTFRPTVNGAPRR